MLAAVRYDRQETTETRLQTPGGSRRRIAFAVCVSDTDVGIQKSKCENIFQKFKQVAETQTDKPTRTGLGLPICKEIVEYFGGNMWVESTPGKGSSFYFTVPVTAEGRVLRPEPEPNGSSPGPTRTASNPKISSSCASGR